MGQKEEDRILSEPAIPLPEEQLRGQQHVSSHCVKGLSRPALVTGLEAETPPSTGGLGGTGSMAKKGGDFGDRLTWVWLLALPLPLDKHLYLSLSFITQKPRTQSAVVFVRVR